MGGLTFLILLLRWSGSGDSGEWVPPGTPHVVIVTALDKESASPSYLRMVEENRKGYASKHGTSDIRRRTESS